MRRKLKKVVLDIFSFISLISLTFLVFHTEVAFASEIDPSIFREKVSKAYTKKFCNAIGFGLSKESAMEFSIEENNQVFKKRKQFDKIDKELLAEEIASSVVEKCGYPINLSGERGILEFKNYYLSKEK